MSHGVWKPIDTAPKDGTHIIVFPAWSSVYKVGVAKWRSSKEIGRWETTFGLGLPKEPTHWMPLPEPPTENE